VGVPSLRDNDRFRVFRDDVLSRVEAALAGVDFEVFVSPSSSKPGIEGIVEAQNKLILRALEGGFDFLWLVQGDVEVPADAFKKLYALDVDVAQGVVLRHDSDELIAGFMDEKAKVWYLPRCAVEDQILSGWVFAGLSCTLIRHRVLEAGLRFRFVKGVGEDVLFMFDVQRAGFEVKVDGRVLCGHLPEWPLSTFSADSFLKPVFKLLDVGCGHRPRGDVNVDLFVEATAHRCADQRVNTDVRLDLRRIRNFVRADGCFLPFRDRSVEKAYSWHLIEHLVDPEAFLFELTRVSAGKIEVRCPNGEFLKWRSETKPLHLHNFSAAWFKERLKAYPDWDWSIRWDYSQGEPWEILVEGYRKELQSLVDDKI